MYTVRFQLELNPSEKRFLSKSFFYANQMHNQIVGYATNRLNALFHDKEYLEARKAYGEAELSKKKASELSGSEKKMKQKLLAIMNNKRNEYKLTKGALYKFVAKEQKKYKNYINSHQAQPQPYGHILVRDDSLGKKSPNIMYTGFVNGLIMIWSNTFLI